MDSKTGLFASWAVSLLLAIALVLQSAKGVARPYDSQEAPQELRLLARNPHQPPSVNVWEFKDPVTGERVMVMTGNVKYMNTDEIKRYLPKGE